MSVPPGTTKAWVTPRPAATPRQLVIQGGFVVDDDGRVRRLERRAHQLGFPEPRSYLQARCEAGHSIPGLARELGESEWTVGQALATLGIILPPRPERLARQRRRHAQRRVGVFNTLIDRARARLDVPTLRTLFGAKQRPRGSADPSPRLAAMIESPRWDLTLFKVHFGRLTLKGYTKGERAALGSHRAQHQTDRLRPHDREVPPDRHPPCGHDRTVLHHPGLHRHRLSARRHPRPTAATLPHRPHPRGRHRPQQATDASRAGGSPGACGRTRRLHRQRPGRQGPDDGRPDRLHHPPGRLRPAQAARQGPARQARPGTPLPRSPHPPPAPSPRCWPSATRSSAPS